MRPRGPRSDPAIADRETVLHVYTVETLYAAVVDGYIDWHKAIVEALIRASLSEDRAVHFHGHERCVNALATLLQFTNAYRQGRDWSCECRCCSSAGSETTSRTTGRAARTSRSWPPGCGRGSLWTRQHNETPDANRVFYRSYAPQVDVGLVTRALRKHRKFAAAARRLGDGAPRVSLVPAVDGHVACLSANCAAWRAAHPLPEPDGGKHDYPRSAFLERAAALRRASTGSRLGTLGLVGPAWD